MCLFTTDHEWDQGRHFESEFYSLPQSVTIRLTIKNYRQNSRTLYDSMGIKVVGLITLCFALGY